MSPRTSYDPPRRGAARLALPEAFRPSTAGIGRAVFASGASRFGGDGGLVQDTHMALNEHSDSSPADNADSDARYDAPGVIAAADEEAHGCESGEGRHRASRDTTVDACLRDWIARMVRQDQQALAELYETMAGRVYGLALRFIRQVQIAEEVTEDCFWKVWRQAPRFDPARGAAIAWIMTIVRSRALDALRRADTTEPLGEERLANIEAEQGNDPQDLLDASKSRTACMPPCTTSNRCPTTCRPGLLPRAFA